MKRPWLIILGGLLLALLAYGGSYLASSAKSRLMESSAMPELAWLQTEFHIPDAEFARITKLHESYLAACAERCQRIDAKNAELESLLARTNTVTPEIARHIQEAAQLRAECQTAMLQHFYEISQTMPPEQGRRYFAWVVSRTFSSEHSSMTHVSADADHEHHHE
jgi:Heavy-metal resistance